MNIEYVVCAEIAKVDSSWFLELRKYFGYSSQKKYFTLNYCKNKEVASTASLTIAVTVFAFFLYEKMLIQFLANFFFPFSSNPSFVCQLKVCFDLDE